MKKCSECGRETFYPEFDGANDWMCDSCAEKLVTRFHEIFGIWLVATTGNSGRVIELAELKSVLRLIKPSMSELRYTIDLTDLREEAER